MKPYKRVMEKKKGLHSVNEYTIYVDDEIGTEKREYARFDNIGKNKRKTIFSDRHTNGKKWNQSGRGGSKNRCSAIQYQQDHAAEVCCEFGFSSKDGGSSGFRSGNKSKNEKGLSLDLNGNCQCGENRDDDFLEAA